MSTVLSFKDGIKARKLHRCAFCCERIEIGDIQDIRVGVQEGEGIWKMHMHPECHAFEDYADLTDDDYEDMSEPLWKRQVAKDHATKLSSAAPIK